MAPSRLLARLTSPTTRSAAPRLSLQALLVTLLTACLLALIHHSYFYSQPVYPPGSLPEDARGGSAGSCKMSFMSPSYLHLSGFGREQTRLGNGPWGLYLYREAGWDADPVLDDGGGEKLSLQGTPVLFVPGNAGSFRQVRSLAAAATRTYWELPGVPRRSVAGRQGAAPLDFFTLDFNDDFSAFHGQTLFDQAEYTADTVRYILSLYAHSGREGRPAPTAVIVVAHSMGGIVARAAMLDPHYQSGSISTIVTLATPHLVPPVTVDSGVDRVYNAINSFWHEAYLFAPSPSPIAALSREPGFHPSTRRTPAEELSSVALISIAGGLSDLTIASESVSLLSLLPASGEAGFTAFTTAIPGVKTPMDHLAILWCRQLMYTVAEGLLSVVDVRRADRVLPREDRVRELKKRWVGGPAAGRAEDEERRASIEKLTRGTEPQVIEAGERLVVRSVPGGVAKETRVFAVPVPPSQASSGPQVFTLLTSARIGRDEDERVEVWACSSLSSSPSSGDADDGNCAPLFPSHVSLLPSSPHAAVSPVLPAPLEEGSMSYLEIEAEDEKLKRMQGIVIVLRDEGEWVVAEWKDRARRQMMVENGAFGLLLSPYRVTLPSFSSGSLAPALVTEISVPALHTSLLTLKARVFRGECHESTSTSLFAPLLEQSSTLLHETKLFPNVRLASLYTHSGGPYLPLPSSSSSASSAARGAKLQLFRDPTCATSGAEGEVAIELSVDWRATLGAIVVRYRMAMVTVPFAVVMLVVALQLREYNVGHPFPPFSASLALFLRRFLGPLLLSLIILSYLQTFLLSFFTTAPPPAWLADALLGNSGAFWAPLAPLLVGALVSVAVGEYLVVVGLVAALAGLAKLGGKTRWKGWFAATEPTPTLPLQRILTISLLLLTVLLFAPYQFAYLVLALVHLSTTVQHLILAWDSTAASSSLAPASSTAQTSGAGRHAWDRYHLSLSVLLILVTLLPVNALILVVWVRNLAVGWLAPFSSDHNVLLLAGYLAVVDAMQSGKMLKRSAGGRFNPHLSTFLFLLPAACALLYGIRYAHLVYALTNFSMLWLALGTSSSFVGLGELAAAIQPGEAVSRTEGAGANGKRSISEPPIPVDEPNGAGKAWVRKLSSIAD